jgi:hypothetical protein
MRCLLVLLVLPLACAAPSKAAPPERPKVTTREREKEAEPLKAPPPSYGNKVVSDERDGSREHARDTVDECRLSETTEREDGPSEAECAPAPTTTVY